MSIIANAPRHMVEDKPPHGAPCNNCGLCCYIGRCVIGRELFGAGPGPCPALTKEDGGPFLCGVIVQCEEHGEDDAAEAAKAILYVGDGCDCRINGEAINEEFNRKCAASEAANKRTRDTALLMWGILEDGK